MAEPIDLYFISHSFILSLLQRDSGQQADP